MVKVVAVLVAAAALGTGLVRAAPAIVTRKVTVPNVVGLQQANAEQHLRAARLRPYVVRVRSNLPVDAVVVQMPRAHTRVALRTRVTIAVSRGPGP